MTVGSVAPKRNCTCPFAPSVGWSFAASQRFASSKASASFGVRLSCSVSFGRRSKTTGGTSLVTVTSGAAGPSADMENKPPNTARPAATIAFTPFLMGSRSPPPRQPAPPTWKTTLRIPRGRPPQLPLRRSSWARDLLRPIDFLHEEAHRVAHDVFLLGRRVERRGRHSFIGRPQPHVALPVALFLAPFNLDGFRRGAKD